MVGRCWHVYRRQSVAKAEKLLHAWAKLHKEDNDLTNGDMSLMLFKWTTELAFIRENVKTGAPGASRAIRPRSPAPGQRAIETPPTW